MKSLPVRGAWIEIWEEVEEAKEEMQSLPVRGAWIEILCLLRGCGALPSLPVRGAWIEILRLAV